MPTDSHIEHADKDRNYIDITHYIAPPWHSEISTVSLMQANVLLAHS